MLLRPVKKIQMLLQFLDYVMPISSSNLSSTIRRSSLNIRRKSAKVQEKEDDKDSQFLTIAPALPVLTKAPVIQKLTKRSYSTYSSSSSTYQTKNDQVGGCNVVNLQQSEEGNFVVATRDPQEREKNPDRICLDRRGLTAFPYIVDEPRLRLMSLQHNLISKIERNQLMQHTKLVFLDLYDNQIDKFCGFESLENLRVLLMGKNKIKKIEGLKGLTKLEVLDLHGNQIAQVSGLEDSTALKVLNLAGNNIKNIGFKDFHGLAALRELNLRRNKIKKLLGFEATPQLQKLYLSNNDVQKIEDMSSIAKALQIRVITIDGNPVTLTAECVSFLVSYLPNLQSVSSMQVTEQIRRTAMAWRTLKEQSNSAFLDLSTQVCVNVRREEVISNAKTNWELLRSQAKCFNSNASKANSIKHDQLRGFTLQNSMDTTTTKVRSLNRSKSKEFGSLSSINEHCSSNANEGKKTYCTTKRSNSSDNLTKIANSTYVDGVEFKLPPILVPIIDNLTNNQAVTAKSSIPSKSNSQTQEYSDSSDSDDDAESSESHHSLKSGLRDHLIKLANRTNSADCEMNDLGVTIKNNSQVFQVSNLSAINVKTQNEEQQQQEQQHQNGKSTTRSRFDFSSKGSSLDSGTRSTFDSSSSSGLSCSDRHRVNSAQVKKIAHYKSNRAATARAKYKATSVPPPAPQASFYTNREQGDDYLVEMLGRCLSVYGQGALRHIDSKNLDPAKYTEVNLVKFNYVHFNGIAGVLGKIKHRFPNAEHFVFKETNISHLGQINALADTGTINSIQIEAEGNPIISKNWKDYAIFRLAHWGLQLINGSPVTEEHINAANEEYSGLADIVIWSIPDALLQPILHRYRLERIQKQHGEQLTAKQFLFASDPAIKTVVAKEALLWRKGNVTQDDLIMRHKGKIHLSQTIDQTINAIQKLQTLNDEWPSILQEIVFSTLLDYSDMGEYMKRRIGEIDRT